MPYRTPEAPRELAPPSRTEPPELLGLGVQGERCCVVYRAHDAVHVVDLDAGGGGLAGRCFDARGACAAAVGAVAWALFVDDGAELASYARGSGAPVARRACERGGADMRALSLSGEPCVLRAGAASRADRGLALSVRGTDLRIERAPGWTAPPSSRALLAATTVAEGPLAVLATDRDDEVDLSVAPASGGAAAASRTVSLGRMQRFECAAGGGARTVVVSRGPGGLVVRTLARDLRSELNPAPVAPRPGARIGRVRCANAGAAFVVAHEEHSDDERRGATATGVVVSVFAGRAPATVRAPLPRLDALAVDGGDVVLASLLGGASGPQLVLYKLRLALDPRGGLARTFSPRRYAYLLESPPCDAPQARRAVLADVAQAVAVSLGARAPDALSLRACDDESDAATFAVRGPDAAHDVRVAVVARRDGSGVARVSIGPERAPPDPPGAPFVERLRRAWSSRAEHAGGSLKVELAQVSAAVGPIVSAVFGLRCIA